MTPVRWLLAGPDEPPAEPAAGDPWLAPEEAERLARLQIAARRGDWRRGRWAAKHALAAHLGLSPRPAEWARLAVLADGDGAPQAWLDRAPAPCTLSLSHRGGLALCTVAPAGTALGCDLEAVEPRSEAFVRDYFTAAEAAWVLAADAADRALLANLVWSAKESALKALRTGLRRDTRSVEVELGGDAGSGGWHPMAVRPVEAAEPLGGWWRREGAAIVTLVAAPPPRLPVRIR